MQAWAYALRLHHQPGRPSRTARTTFIPTCPRPIRSASMTSPCAKTAEISFYDGGGRKDGCGITPHPHRGGRRKADARRTASAGTLVDFNRCGVPLIEIVSASPTSAAPAEEARAYLEASQERCWNALASRNCTHAGGLHPRAMSTSPSVRPGERPLGNRVEMKNVNTFSGAVRGIEYEINAPD